MDVDGPPGQAITELGGEDAQGAGRHHQLDLLGLDVETSASSAPERSVESCETWRKDTPLAPTVGRRRVPTGP